MTREIAPHGNVLVNRVAVGEHRSRVQEKARGLKKLVLNEREVSDLYMLGIGAFSPLEGFLNRENYLSVVEGMRLTNGVVWSIPITLSVDAGERKDFEEGEDIALSDEDGDLLAVLSIGDIYSYDREKEAQLVYGTKDVNHPGVAYIHKQGDYLIGGKIFLLDEPGHKEFGDYWFTPARVRAEFRERGWNTVVGFQTRNPIHRAHEFIIKSALEIVDGLFLNPLVGETKQGDIPAAVRVKCYLSLIERYFPKGRVFMGVYGAAMRYAGPREAILHAIVRRNFGCTHFIVGRDHAGVGNYYGPFDAQEIFGRFKPEEIGITPLFFENAFYCRRCNGMATVKTCPHPEVEHLSFSGTRVRELLKAQEVPPPEFTRPEIANILLEWWRGEEVR